MILHGQTTTDGDTAFSYQRRQESLYRHNAVLYQTMLKWHPMLFAVLIDISGIFFIAVVCSHRIVLFVDLRFSWLFAAAMPLVNET